MFWRRQGLLAAAALGLAATGLAACDEGEDTAPPNVEQSPAQQEPAQAEPESDADVSADHVEEEPAQPDASAADQGLELPQGLPADLPQLGLPFYVPAELVATPSVGGPWVLEFVTDDDLATVNDFIAANLTAENGWQDVSEEITGDQTVTFASKDGYDLVVAVAPEMTTPERTSLFYTLNEQ